MRLQRLGLLSLAVGMGCAPTFSRPFTAAQLQQQWSGEALVFYLSQPDASPTVCDVRWRDAGQGVPISDFMRDTLVEGLVEGRVPPAIWRGCVDRMVRTAQAGSAALLLDRITAAYTEALGARKVETDPVLQARAEALQGAYLNRPSDRSAHSHAVASMAAELRKMIAQGWLGPWASQRANTLLNTIDIERGWLRGRPVDGTVLDQLLAAGDETLLMQMAQHLPRPELRAEARRRVIHLHVQTSDHPEVRHHAAAVEQTLLVQGRNPISTEVHPPLRARLDLPVRQVRVRQQVLPGTAALFGAAAARPDLSVLPELSLRGALVVDVEGLPRPVTLCAPAAALAAEPCLAAGDVTIASPLVTLDDEGVLHFVESLTSGQVGELAREVDQIAIPISVSHRHLADLKWELAFEKPADLVLEGPAAGPDLLVRVEKVRGGRLLERVRTNGAEYQAVVEEADAAAFRIVSRGRDGRSGSSGTDGSDGSHGMSGSHASCPSSHGGDGGRGRDGSDGRDGGNGTDGSDGGSIQVEVACGGVRCTELVAQLRNAISSVGGRGGPGGKGGRGGDGGRGGSGGFGTTCTSDNRTVSLSGGSDGMRGRDGSSGHDGRSGSDGASGRVTFLVVGP